MQWGWYISQKKKKQSKMSIFVLVCILYIYEVQVVKLTSVIE